MGTEPKLPAEPSRARIREGVRVVARYHNDPTPRPGVVVNYSEGHGYWIVACDDGKRLAFSGSELEVET